MRKLTTQDFIDRARAVHGDWYDYSLAVYDGTDRKVKIICPEHGVFEQSPGNHCSGKKCSKCALIQRAMKRTKTTSQFIEEARNVHGDSYDYSQVQYTGQRNEVKIICPIHGEFTQRPKTHLRGHGCYECGLLTITEKKSFTTSEFIDKATQIHGDRFDYSEVDYHGTYKNVTIICQIHGKFEQAPSTHLSSNGCPACSGAERYDKDGFIKRARLVHGDKYDYSNTGYVNARQKLEIICPDHGSFLQIPQHHIVGVGCPQCGEYGFNPAKPAILYYLRIETRNQIAYKVGITNRTVEERFQNGDMERITILNETYYDRGIDAYSREQEILKEYSKYKYKGEPILTTGNSELFSHDVLKLDTGFNID